MTKSSDTAIRFFYKTGLACILNRITQKQVHVTALLVGGGCLKKTQPFRS